MLPENVLFGSTVKVAVGNNKAEDSQTLTGRFICEKFVTFMLTLDFPVKWLFVYNVELVACPLNDNIFLFKFTTAPELGGERPNGLNSPSDETDTIEFSVEILAFSNVEADAVEAKKKSVTIVQNKNPNNFFILNTPFLLIQVNHNTNIWKINQYIEIYRRC